ncbi:MAG: hypothetical protein J0M18_18935, partial [Ignavibacteria bacterium]|nr:hypothetical protein [Ignavibacteria bacterium]
IKWGYKKFRYGGEIEEGTGIVADTDVKKVQAQSNSITSGQGFDIAKDVVTSVAIGSVMNAVFRQMRR